jgi:hypothetical protein
MSRHQGQPLDLVCAGCPRVVHRFIHRPQALAEARVSPAPLGLRSTRTRHAPVGAADRSRDGRIRPLREAAGQIPNWAEKPTTVVVKQGLAPQDSLHSTPGSTCLLTRLWRLRARGFRFFAIPSPTPGAPRQKSKRQPQFKFPLESVWPGHKSCVNRPRINISRRFKWLLFAMSPGTSSTVCTRR